MTSKVPRECVFIIIPRKKAFQAAGAGAAGPAQANRLYEYFIERLREKGINVKTGVFAADMTVEIINDGPATLMLDTDG